ncbi:unnamed protein product [Acanthoscelides obtectus]|uniref:DDE Tnp4 domain-containing protein n=1 Tax=Acanthoscelides obtectus TaxID=200917 RepID=A0A9P0PNF1_ACAOB|nr:unnamed protein product [Acanthoscelides obtectus]CAK1655305.1 Protein ALP1-like [Acanthoscelides obtectus]
MKANSIHFSDDSSKMNRNFTSTIECLQKLFDLLRIPLTKQNTKFRQSISPHERLTIFLRFLSTEADYQTLFFNFRIGHSTIHKIINHTANVIWETLGNIVMPQPTTQLLQYCANKFESTWNFPNCVGAIDGKYVTIQAPPRSGSLYFNYKKSFSVVLLAIVDAEYRFVAVDVGAYGKNSDGGIFNDSNMRRSLKNGTFGMPKDRAITANGESLPHVIVGDEAFPCKTYLMRPYSGRGLSQDKRIFNYRLSRARRLSENAFGILCQKFRIFLNKLNIHPKNADKIILSSLCLHNFLRNDNYFLTVLEQEKTENEAPVLTLEENALVKQFK